MAQTLAMAKPLARAGPLRAGRIWADDGPFGALTIRFYRGFPYFSDYF